MDVDQFKQLLETFQKQQQQQQEAFFEQFGTLFRPEQRPDQKKKSSEQLLEQIQKDIDSIDHDLQFAFQRQKVIVGRLVIYSVTLYIIIAIVFYLFFFPPSMRDRIIYVIPLLLFPLIIVYAKRFVTWVYKRDIVRSQEKLSDLLTQKKKTLEEVMNKETYKKAKEILDKYAPEKNAKPLLAQTPMMSQISQPLRTGERTAPVMNEQTPLTTHTRQTTPPQRNPSPVSSTSRPTPVLLPRSAQPLPRKLVRPIFQLERGYLDRIVEALVGDGPNRRYALICKHCASHNGMALKEEFEYLAYRCVYCGCPNPAMKVRPRPSPFSYAPQINRELNLTPGFLPPDRRMSMPEGENIGNPPAEESDQDNEASSSITEENKTLEEVVEKMEVDEGNEKIIEAEVKENDVEIEEVEGDDKKNR